MTITCLRPRRAGQTQKTRVFGGFFSKNQSLSVILPASAVAAILPIFPAQAQVPGRILYAVIGATDPARKVPALDAVPGAGVSNVAVPLPVTILRPGVGYTVTFGAQIINFTGTCVASYTLSNGASGGHVISYAYTAPIACAAYSIWTFPFPAGIIPNLPGPAILTASLKLGTATINTFVPVTIQ